MNFQRIRLILALVSILAGQLLVIAHAVEHPILDDHPCQICLHFQGPEHALAPPMQTPQTDARCEVLASEDDITASILFLPAQRSRAPPLLS